MTVPGTAPYSCVLGNVADVFGCKCGGTHAPPSWSSHGITLTLDLMGGPMGGGQRFPWAAKRGEP